MTQPSLTNKLFARRRFRWILFLQLFWIALVFLLGGWWCKTALNQAEHIAQLERQLGVSTSDALTQWQKTQNMFFWESVVFFVLLAAMAFIFGWIYWRDLKRSRSLQGFLAAMTHELRTPLTSIRLQAESLLEEISPQQSGYSLVQRLLEDTSRLEHQVSKTLELARLEGGGQVFDQTFDLRKSIDDAARYYKDRLTVDADLPVTHVQGDAGAFQIVLRNLFENSVHHSHADSPSISLSTFRDDEWCVVSYRDNGKGFAGDWNKLGAPFFRGSLSRGAGIGLYLVKTLMERMGGRAQFFSGTPRGFGVNLRFRGPA